MIITISTIKTYYARTNYYNRALMFFKSDKQNIIAVRGVGVPFIYTARPEGVRYQKALAGKSLRRNGV